MTKKSNIANQILKMNTYGLLSISKSALSGLCKKGKSI